MLTPLWPMSIQTLYIVDAANMEPYLCSSCRSRCQAPTVSALGSPLCLLAMHKYQCHWSPRLAYPFFEPTPPYQGRECRNRYTHHRIPASNARCGLARRLCTGGYMYCSEVVLKKRCCRRSSGERSRRDKVIILMTTRCLKQACLPRSAKC